MRGMVWVLRPMNQNVSDPDLFTKAMDTTLATTFDSLVTTVLQVQRQTEALMDKLHYINSDVHGMFGTPDLETIQETLAELQLDLPELAASAALPLAACAPFAAEVGRRSSEKDTLELPTDGTAAEHAGACVEAARPCA